MSGDLTSNQHCDLPSWEFCAHHVEGGTACALERFIYAFEPIAHEAEVFRRDLQAVLAEARADFESEPCQCAKCTADEPTPTPMTPVAAAAKAKPANERDLDWIIAIAHGIGVDTGFHVPIVPEQGVFRDFFNQIRARLAPPPDDVQRDAERWRALLGCARVRVMGCAGLHDPQSNYAHIGVEFWTHHPAQSNPEAIETILKFVERAALTKPALRKVEFENGVELCSDCPPVSHTTDTTRCDECPRLAVETNERPVIRNEDLWNTGLGWPGNDKR